MTQITDDFFWSKVDKTDTCWNWTGGVNSAGYGMFKFSEGSRLCHRRVWEHVNGKIPHGLLALHKCDNPKCCNPEHIFIGTHKDNTHDMIKKDRGRCSARSDSRIAKLLATKPKIEIIVAPPILAQAEPTALTVSQFAAIVGVQPGTVKRWLYAGRLEGYKIGGDRGQWRISHDEMKRVTGRGGL